MTTCSGYTCLQSTDLAAQTVRPGVSATGFRTVVTNNGYVYQENGVSYLAYESNLRPFQRRQFCTFAEFDSGCVDLYCRSGSCPKTLTYRTSADTKTMFNQYFPQ